MRFLYFLKVMALSIEMLLILLGGYILYAQLDVAQAVASRVQISEEMLKYLTLVPAGLAGWIFVESRKLVFEKEAVAKLLVAWPDYWMLRVHINASMLFAVVFTLISFGPWVMPGHLSSGAGLVLFLLGILGQVVVAGSVYLAGFKIQELGIDAPKVT